MLIAQPLQARSASEWTARYHRLDIMPAQRRFRSLPNSGTNGKIARGGRWPTRLRFELVWEFCVPRSAGVVILSGRYSPLTDDRCR
ncbi:MAG: hypothetical protein DWH78_00135 [Planctomycetota bacterium]|nr:MAG: hypothetical protein DWH78_00135 [Planctomycetota bacterium]